MRFYVALSTAITTMAFVFQTGSVLAEDGSRIDGVEFEASYTYVGVSKATEFSAVGDWNDNGTEFGLDTQASDGPLGISVGARWFPLREDLPGLAPWIRASLATADMSIQWVNQYGTPIESTGLFWSLAIGCDYKLAIARDALGKDQSVYFVPGVGIGYGSFTSTPVNEDDPENNDSFGFGSFLVSLRATLEVDVTPTTGVFIGFEYNLAPGWNASRSFDDGREVTGSTEGSANIWKIVAGATL